MPKRLLTSAFWKGLYDQVQVWHLIAGFLLMLITGVTGVTTAYAQVQFDLRTNSARITEVSNDLDALQKSREVNIKKNDDFQRDMIKAVTKIANDVEWLKRRYQ